MIVSFIDDDHATWDQHLSEFRFTYNCAFHTSLKSSPAFLNFGRNPIPINSLRRRVKAQPEIETRNPESWQERMRQIQSMREWVIRNLDDAFFFGWRFFFLDFDPPLNFRFAFRVGFVFLICFVVSRLVWDLFGPPQGEGSCDVADLQHPKNSNKP